MSRQVRGFRRAVLTLAFEELAAAPALWTAGAVFEGLNPKVKNSFAGLNLEAGDGEFLEAEEEADYVAG